MQADVSYLRKDFHECLTCVREANLKEKDLDAGILPSARGRCHRVRRRRKRVMLHWLGGT